MRLLSVWVVLALATLAAAQFGGGGLGGAGGLAALSTQFVRDPLDPSVLLPVVPDYSRPRVRLTPTTVEAPPSPLGLLPLLALMLATPILLFTGNSNDGLFGGGGGGGGIFVNRESICC